MQRDQYRKDTKRLKQIRCKEINTEKMRREINTEKIQRDQNR